MEDGAWRVDERRDNAHGGMVRMEGVAHRGLAHGEWCARGTIQGCSVAHGMLMYMGMRMEG